MQKKNENSFFDSNLQFQKRKIVKKTQQDDENSSEGTQQLEQCQKIEQGKSKLPEANILIDLVKQTTKKQKIKQAKDQKGNKTQKQEQPDKKIQRLAQINQKNKPQNELIAEFQNSKKQQLHQTLSQSNKLLSQSPIKLPLARRPVHIVAISDNHGDYKMMNQILQLNGDIFIHAGDFTYQGKDQDFEKFFIFLDKLKFRHKIVISGNHQNVLSRMKLKALTKMSRQNILQKLKKKCTYLQHESIEIQGLKIFASPYTPEYCQKPTSRAFQYKPSQDNLIWSNIPENIDLLITHGPPFGIMDSGKNGKRAGSEALKLVVEKIKPKYHVFGHIHESKGGMTKVKQTTYINLCNTPTRFII